MDWIRIHEYAMALFSSFSCDMTNVLQFAVHITREMHLWCPINTVYVTGKRRERCISSKEVTLNILVYRELLIEADITQQCICQFYTNYFKLPPLV